MTTKTTRKIGSLIVSVVVVLIIVKVFQDQPYATGVLCLAAGFGLGMMRQ